MAKLQLYAMKKDIVGQQINIFQYEKYAKENNKPKYLDSNYRYDENDNVALFFEVGDNDKAFQKFLRMQHLEKKELQSLVIM